MINTTATTLGVKGNGKGLGITNGTDTYGFFLGTTALLYTSQNALGQPIGFDCQNINYATIDHRTSGLVTDASTSGIIANMPATVAPTKWVIKY